MRRNLRWVLGMKLMVLLMACLVLVMACMSLSNWANASSGTPTLHYFLDTHSQLTIEDLLSNPNATQFAAASETPLAVGFSPYPVWLKWQLTTANNHNMLKLDSFLLKQIDLYEVIEHATIEQQPGERDIGEQQPSEPASLRHKKIDSPRLFSNALAITPGVNSTVWVRLTANSAIHLSATFITSAIDHLPSTDNLNLLVFAITLSLGFVGVILHTQSQQQRLSLLPLQSLLLVCSGLNLPIISQLGFTDHALTAGLLLTFFMHLHHSVREQSWWPVRQLQIVRGVLVLLLIANCWPNTQLTSALLLIIGLLAYALWAPFARIPMNSNTLKMRLHMITPDLFFGFVCLSLLSLHIGTWPYPHHSEIICNLTLMALSMSLMLLQVRTFIDEHRRPSSASPLANAGDAKAFTLQAFKNETFKPQALNNFTPQPVWYNSALLPLVKSGMRQLDGKERLHDHLSVIQQDSNLPASANAIPPAADLGATLDTAALVSKSFNLRILGHDILQQLEHLCHQQQTPLLFAIKPDTHTHLIGTADALVLVLQQLTRHSLQCNTSDSPPHLKNNTVQNTISVRIEEETLPETDYPDHQHPLLLKSHLRDNSCLDEEHLHWLNQTLDQLTAAQMSQLLHAYPHLIIAKQWLEQLHGTLHIHREGSTTTCYSVSLLMQSVQIHQPEPPQSFLTLKDKRILLMTYDGEYGMTMTEQASGQDIPMSLALSISQARRNLQHSQHTDAQFDLLVLDCSQAEETLHAFIKEIQGTLPGYAKTPLLLLHKQWLHKPEQTQPPTDHRESDHCKHAAKPSAFVQLGALITGLLNKPLAA
jgi:hypothetical protein